MVRHATQLAEALPPLRACRVTLQHPRPWRCKRGLTVAGYHKGTPELRERAYQTLLTHGGAMQNHELAKLALREAWPIHHTKMWGTHGLLNTLCEEGGSSGSVAGDMRCWITQKPEPTAVGLPLGIAF